MLNYTNYAIHVYVCGEVVRFSSTSEGNTLLLCSFRIHALYLCPCFKLPFLDLRSKAIHNVKHKINKASSFQLLKLGKFTAMIILHFDLQPQFKYMNYFIYTSHHFTPHGRYELNKLASPPMCGFIAQLVEHRTGIAEFTGSNPVEALFFSGFFFPIA